MKFVTCSTQSQFIDENIMTANKGQTMCINWSENKPTMEIIEKLSVKTHEAMVNKV